MNYHGDDIDLNAIEEEARNLRAEAVKYGLGQARVWIASAFSKLFGGSGQHA